MNEAGWWLFGIVVILAIIGLSICRTKAVDVRVNNINDDLPPQHINCRSVMQPFNNEFGGDSDIPPRAFGVGDIKVNISEYMPKPLPVGWQGWEGGFNPLLQYNQSNTEVVVMLRNGTILPPDIAGDLCWFHFDDRPRAGDIVAWRIA